MKQKHTKTKLLFAFNSLQLDFLFDFVYFNFIDKCMNIYSNSL